MANILLLEDDEMLLQSIKDYLELEEFNVSIARNGEEALDLTFDNSYDLYLLDVNVPLLNGFNFLKSLRDSGDKTPAFFITALKDLDSISQAFDSGADDYIKKPFDIDELIIRLKATLKKQYNDLKLKDIVYNPIQKLLTKKDKVINLSIVELNIFDTLIKNLNEIVTKDMLFEAMEKESSQALRFHINKLKSKLDIEIKNIRGVGYRLEEI